MKALLTLPLSFYNGYPRLSEELENLGITVEKIISDVPVDKSVIIEHIKDADIYILAVERVDADVIQAAKNLKLIVKPAAGFDNIDIEEATRRKIPVTFAPGYNAASVADLAFALLLAAARKIIPSDTVTKKGDWKLFMGTELTGKTIGIMGFGNIGKMVARRAAGFGMDIIAYDMYHDDRAAEELGVTFCELDELLSKADFISINLALTKETVGMINKEKFKLFKKNAIIINTSRGPVINEEDLIEALKSKKIAGAALDVYNREPPNQELVCLDSVISTCHIGGSTNECAERMFKLCVENVRRFLEGEKLLHVINTEVID